MSIKSIVIKKALEHLMGVDKRTQTDLYNQLSSLITNLGTQSYDTAGWLLTRQKHSYNFIRSYFAGRLVAAGTTDVYLDFSGAGVIRYFGQSEASGDVASKCVHFVRLDGVGDDRHAFGLGPESWNFYGLTTVGHYPNLGIIRVWDTTANVYRVFNTKDTLIPFSSRIYAFLKAAGTVNITFSGDTHYAYVSSSTYLEFIRSLKEYESIEVRQQLIDLGYECEVGLQVNYDSELAVNKPILFISTEKTLDVREVDEIIKFVYDNEYAVEIVRIENVLASPRKLVYKVTPIEEVQVAISKVARVGREIPVLPRLRAGRIEETVALIPNWLNRLRPDLIGRVHSLSEINEILTTKPYEVIP